MDLFFSRRETDREVVITHKPWFHFLLIAAIAVWGIAGTQPEESVLRGWAGLLWFVTIAVMVWRAVSMRKVWREMNVAMKAGGVSMRGSRFNPLDPLTVHIAKAPD
jgi:hypothetical protein